MTPRRSYDDAVDAVRAGAIDLILKAPDSVAYLKDRVLDAAGPLGRQARGRHGARRHQAACTRSFSSASWRPSAARSISPTRSPAAIRRASIKLDELRVLVVDEVDDFVDARSRRPSPKGFAFVHATSGGEGLDRISGGTFHYAMVAEDVTDLPAKTIARTIRNQHPDTVVLTFLGPVRQRPRRARRDPRQAHDRQAVHRGRTARRPARRARRGVAREGARAPLHAGVSRAPLRLPAPLRRAQDEDRARDARGSGLGHGRERDVTDPRTVASGRDGKVCMIKVWTPSFRGASARDIADDLRVDTIGPDGYSSVGMVAPRTVVIVNPKSQGGRLGKRWARARRHARPRVPVRRGDHAGSRATRRELAREALRAGAERIVAIGGDGTINEVVNGFFDDGGQPIAPRGELRADPVRHRRRLPAHARDAARASPRPRR